MVIFIPPDFLGSAPSTRDTRLRDITIASLTASTFLYVASASFLASSVNPIVPALRDPKVRAATFCTGIILFHLGNMVSAFIIFLLTDHFELKVAFWATLAVLLAATVFELLNLFLASFAIGIILAIVLFFWFFHAPVFALIFIPNTMRPKVGTLRSRRSFRLI
jgi:hypothetical protein